MDLAELRTLSGEGVKILILEVKTVDSSILQNCSPAVVNRHILNNDCYTAASASNVDATRNLVVEVCGKTEPNNVNTAEENNKLTVGVDHNINILGLAEIVDAVRNQEKGSLKVQDATRNPNVDLSENEVLLSIVDSDVNIAQMSEPTRNPTVTGGGNKILFSAIGEETAIIKTCENNNEELSNANCGALKDEVVSQDSESTIAIETDTNSRELPKSKVASAGKGKRLARCSGYNVFFQEYLTTNPGKSFGSVAKAAGKLWKTLTPDQKQDYAMHAEKHTQQLEAQLHTGDRKYVCPKCNRKISHHKNFANHVKECGQKFPCPSCDSVFMERRNLTKHINAVHEKVKTYMCKFCKKGFAYRKDLVRHMVQHSGESPYECPTCRIKFSWKCNLRRHQLKASHYAAVAQNEGDDKVREPEVDPETNSEFVCNLEVHRKS